MEEPVDMDIVVRQAIRIGELKAALAKAANALANAADSVYSWGSKIENAHRDALSFLSDDGRFDDTSNS